MTIKDIARESGYAVGTVSRALNLSLIHIYKNRGCKFVHQADFAINRKKRLIIAPERCIIRSIRNGNVSDETNQHPCKSLFFLSLIHI